MDLLTYLMARKKKKIFSHKGDLLAYLLETNRKPIKTASGTHIEIDTTIPNIALLTIEKESTQEITTGNNLIGLDTEQYQVDLKAGDIITVTNNTHSTITLDLFTNYGDITRNDYWTVQTNQSPRTITIGYDAKAIKWHSEINGLAWVNLGTTALPYEPYTGGIPAPNPDFPEPINVIKNSLTIEITDGENTKTATIDLGDNEVVGIGNYKDIIKVDRSGNVTLTKNIGKVILNGTEEGWSKYSYTFNISNLYTGTPQYSLCSHFTNAGPNWVSSNESYRGKYTTTNSSNQFKCMPLVDMTLQEFKTWLSAHNTILYYVLAEAEEPISLGTIDLSLFKGSNTITNSSEAYMTIKYY